MRAVEANELVRSLAHPETTMNAAVTRAGWYASYRPQVLVPCGKPRQAESQRKQNPDLHPRELQKRPFAQEWVVGSDNYQGGFSLLLPGGHLKVKRDMGQLSTVGTCRTWSTLGPTH